MADNPFLSLPDAKPAGGNPFDALPDAKVSPGADAQGFSSVSLGQERLPVSGRPLTLKPDLELPAREVIPRAAAGALSGTGRAAESLMQFFHRVQSAAPAEENNQHFLPNLGAGMREYLESLNENVLRGDPAFDATEGAKLAAGAGSIPPAMAAGPFAPFVTGGMIAGEVRDDALSHGASPTDAEAAGAIAAPVAGVFDAALGMGKLFRFAKAAEAGAPNPIGRLAGVAAGGAASEGIGEQAASNVIARDVLGYDPDRSRSEGVLDAAKMGAILQGGVGTATQVAADIDANQKFKRGTAEALTSRDPDGQIIDALLGRDQNLEFPPPLEQTEDAAAEKSRQLDRIGDQLERAEREQVRNPSEKTRKEARKNIKESRARAEAEAAERGEALQAARKPEGSIHPDDVVQAAQAVARSLESVTQSGKGSEDTSTATRILNRILKNADLTDSQTVQNLAAALNLEVDESADRGSHLFSEIVAVYPSDAEIRAKNKRASDQKKFREADVAGKAKHIVDKVSKVLESKKIKTKGKVLDASIGLPVTVINGAISAAQLAVEAGGASVDYAQAAIDHVKAAHKKKFDEKKLRDYLEGKAAREAKTAAFKNAFESGDMEGAASIAGPEPTRAELDSINVQPEATQRATKVHDNLLNAGAISPEAYAEGDALIYGAGKGGAVEGALRGADTYEPFPPSGFKPTFTGDRTTGKGDPILRKYKEILNTFVLNVVDPETREKIIDDIGGLLADNGRAVIVTRGNDVANSKPVLDFGGLSRIAKSQGKLTYQKGFTQSELEGLVKDTLGAGFTVRKLPGYKGNPAVEVVKETSKIKDSASRLAQKVRGAKVDTRGKVFDGTIGLPVAIWNAMVEVAAKTIEVGGSTAQAINDAVNWLKRNHQGKVDEKKAREAMGKVVRDDSITDITPQEVRSHKRGPKDHEEAMWELTKGDRETFSDDVKRMAVAFRDRVKELRGTDLPKHKQPDPRLRRTLGDAARAFFDSKSIKLRRWGKRWKSAAFGKAADSLQTLAGSGKHSEMGVFDRIDQTTGMLFNRYEKATEPIQAMLDSRDEAGRRSLRERIGKLVADESLVVPEGRLGDVIQEVRNINRDLLDYQKQSGVDIGDVGYAYLTRRFDYKEIAAKPSQFMRAAKSYFKNEEKMKDADAADAARSLFDSMGERQAGFDPENNPLFATKGATSVSETKGRKFSKGADRYFNDFYHRDIDELMSGYINSSIRRAEYARSFGEFDGETGKFDKWAKIKKWNEEMIKDGVDPKAIEDFNGLMADALTGFRRSNRIAKTFAHVTNTLTTLAFMQLATLSSLPEPLLAGVPTNSMAQGLKASLISIKRFAQEVAHKDSTARQAAQTFGIIGDTFDKMGAALRYNAPESQGRIGKAVTDRMLRATFLTQWTNATRIAIKEIADTWFMKMATDIRNGDISKGDKERLIEMGIEEGRLKEFSDWMHKPDGTARDTFSAPKLTDRTSMDRVYADAQFMFNRQASARPNAATRNSMAGDSAMFSMVMALSSYMYDFSQNILGTMNRRFVRGARDGFGARQAISQRDASALRLDQLFAHRTMPLLILAAYAVNELRNRVGSSAERRRTAAEESPVTKAVAAFSRAGGFGRYDSLVNIYGSFKYQRDPATVLSGPLPAKVAQMTKAIAQVAKDSFDPSSDPKNNTAERTAAREFWNSAVKGMGAYGGSAIWGIKSRYPVVNLMSGLLASSVIQATGHPAVREGFVNVVAGEKPRSGGSIDDFDDFNTFDSFDSFE